MVLKKKKTSNTSELRQDPITDTWAIIVSGRSNRPKELTIPLLKKRIPPSYKESCAFCNTGKHRQRPDTYRYPKGKKWNVRIFPNKYPALFPSSSNKITSSSKKGPFASLSGTGFHEVAIVREHNGLLYRLSPEIREQYITAWLSRYRDLKRFKHIKYIQIFENSGAKAGGSMEHPHSQIFALPILPKDAHMLLTGAEKYTKRNNTCAFCDIVEFELKEKERIVYENDEFLVIVPFVPRVPHEQWIIPKAHSSNFEALSEHEIPFFGDAIGKTLSALAKGFGLPDYNFQIYSAPCGCTKSVCHDPVYPNFHWHARIMPRIGVWGGFEMATGLEVISAMPEESALQLRENIT